MNDVRLDSTLDSFALSSSLQQTTHELAWLLRESHERLVAALELAEVARLEKATETEDLPDAARDKLRDLVQALDDLDPTLVRWAAVAADEAGAELDEIAGAAREVLYKRLAAASDA